MRPALGRRFGSGPLWPRCSAPPGFKKHFEPCTAQQDGASGSPGHSRPGRRVVRARLGASRNARHMHPKRIRLSFLPLQFRQVDTFVDFAYRTHHVKRLACRLYEPKLRVDSLPRCHTLCCRQSRSLGLPRRLRHGPPAAGPSTASRRLLGSTTRAAENLCEDRFAYCHYKPVLHFAAGIKTGEYLARPARGVSGFFRFGVCC